jgi:hypothetical protein
MQPLLRRCLQKDPDKRLRNIGDVKLEDILANPNELLTQPVMALKIRMRLKTALP